MFATSSPTRRATGRWSGAAKVGSFLDELVAAVHDLDPECLCTYSNYPPTEFLQPRELGRKPALRGGIYYQQHLAPVIFQMEFLSI